MDREHDEALEALLDVLDRRRDAAPVVDRSEKGNRRDRPVEARVNAWRARGPVRGAFAYWESKTGRPR